MSALQRRLADVAPLFRRISRQTGLRFPPSRTQELTAGIARLMRRHEIEDIGCLVDHLGDPRIFDAVIRELTVGETYFFRDPAQFETIRKVILPSLLQNRPATAPIRIWSAGCSTGEEPYSMAILLDEEGLLERAKILATDISSAALRRARKAEYGGWSFRDDGVARPRRYFSRTGDRFRLDERIRRAVTFRSLNLASDPFPSGNGGFDLILCRNVLMYFEGGAVKRLARRFFDCVDEGGWLITGPSDPPLWDHAPFRTETTPAGVFYRRGPRMEGLDGANGADSGGRPGDGSGRGGALTARAGRHETDRAPARGRDPKPTKSAAECAARIRALSDAGEIAAAAQAALDAVKQHPLAPELHYLQGVVLMAEGRDHDAVAALRRALYLDRTLAAAHFLLGHLLEGREPRPALRAFRNVVALCAARPAGEAVPLAGGDTAGRLAEVARARIARLSQRAGGGTR